MTFPRDPAAPSPREPQPTDGPDYHADHAAWLERIMAVKPFADLKHTGLLWLINRVCLHPRGYALALHYPDDATHEQIMAGEAEPTGWSIRGDGCEVWTFSEGDDGWTEDQAFADVAALLDDAAMADRERRSVDKAGA